MIAVVIVAVSQEPGSPVRVTLALPTDPLQRCTLVWAADVPAAYVATLDDQRRRQTPILVPDSFFALDPVEQRVSFGRGLQGVLARQREHRPPAS